MSLRRQIFWLFIALAVAPLLLFAGFTQQQSLAVIEYAAETRLVSDAQAVARRLSREAAAAEAALQVFASVGSSAAPPSAARLAELRTASGGMLGGGFLYLQAVDPAGTVLSTAGQVPPDIARCGPGGHSVLIHRGVPLGPAGWTLAGGYWVGQTLGPERMSGVSTFDGQGRLLYSSECDGSQAALFPMLPARGTAGVIRLDGSAENSHGAYARVGNLGWTAVVATASPFRAPIGRLFRNYWIFVLALCGATALAFSMLVGRVTRSIEDLTRAAERVGAGDLRPWLPPPNSDEVGRLTFAFSQMTDRLRETMKQVDRSGRLAVVGQLSAYLAHEIRNPLSSVKMNLQRLQRWEKAGAIPEQAREPIDVSLKEVDRLSAAVSNVLQLSRAQDKPPEVVSIHDLVTDAGKLLESEFARVGVRLRLELRSEVDRVLARPGQIKGVVINLMLNALDAQPGGGELRIRSDLVPGSPAEPGPHLELRFRDSGPGVPKEIRDRIFEPFFTTKQSGSGIGLAVAIQAVRDNHGRLFLEDPSWIDQGAEFVVTFPLAAVSRPDTVPTAYPPLAPWMQTPAADVRPPTGSARRSHGPLLSPGEP